MKVNFFVNEIYSNLANTAMVLLALAIIYFVCYAIIYKKSDNEKSRITLKVRLTYLLIFAFTFFLARIWVEGFEHLFTIFTVISAGLVIANKEVVLNFVSGLVINWRDIFAEGDYIEIGNIKGYVFNMSMLYFKVNEQSSLQNSRLSGRVVKIPNSLVMSTPVICHRNKRIPIEFHESWYLPTDSVHTVDAAKVIVLEQSQGVLSQQYPERFVFPSPKKSISSVRFDPSARVQVEMCYQSEIYVKLHLIYYCYPEHQSMIKEKLSDTITPMLVKKK